MPAIRAIALVALRREDEILLMYGDDSVMKRPFHRAPGGGIEFGEPAEAAARREIREELSVELDAIRHLGTLENIFTFEGSPGHEVVFVFEADWPAHLPHTPTVEAHEDDGVPFTTRWFRLTDLPRPGYEVVPPGFLELVLESRPGSEVNPEAH